MTRYLIGIDLGTTNSALAYVDARKRGGPEIQTFAVPQLVAPGETAPRSLLPSFLYLPGAHDLPAKACALPWDAARTFMVGEFARNHGGKVPGRLVSSAKSWLCHAGVDRTAAILPWNGLPDVPRLSPVEVSSRYLRHMVEAWNHTVAKDHAEDRLENQQVVLTVPASFDDVARTLTVEAARKAGIDHLTLVEEPQAAFYAWLARANVASPEKEVAEASLALAPGMMCLVVDVGGGTTDLTLIEAVEDEGTLGFVRQAVGDHLLLGGDNMDLALAKFVETKLPQPAKLDAVSFGMLGQACRQAKEMLLKERPPAEHTVAVVGRGRQVVGATQHASITPADVRKVLHDGFFPDAAGDAEPARSGRVGLHEMGLPYVSDPAITRHLAAFLKQHLGERSPDAILFNGGVFQPLSLRERLLHVMRQWYGKSWKPLVLTNPSLDLAVAWGAAYYAWLRQSGGKRIRGGLARSYYIAIDTSAPEEAAGKPADGVTVLCVVPRQMEEGSELHLKEPELELALGQPVSFPLYTSTVRGKDKPGKVLKLAEKQLLRLPPLHTILRGGKRSGTKNVPVALASRLTEIGTLELFLEAHNSDNRWRLEFNVRETLGPAAERPGDEAEDEADADVGGITETWPEELVQAAAACIRPVYASAAEQPARELTKALEAALKASREDWPTGLCRRLWDFLSEVADGRRLSPAHLARWYHLVGFCLRPGFGDPLDRFRIDQLWKLLHAAPGKQAGGAARVIDGGADYWIMFRRVSGGLNATQQQSLMDRLRSVLIPAKTSKGAPYKPGANELAEMWRAGASFERLDPKQKEPLGQALLKPLKRSPVPTYGFWSLARLGNRALLYGPLNCVVHHEVAEAWLDSLLPFQPGTASERNDWIFCLAQLARRTGQRALDINDEMRTRVLDTLRAVNARAHPIEMVEIGGELEAGEEKQLLGDALPIGLRLVRGA
jgi:hypothetical protein